MRHVPLAILLLLSACASHDGGHDERQRGARIPLTLLGEPLGRPMADEAAYADIVVVWAKGLDANHDGFLSPDELKPDIARFFQVIDQDKDGSINSRELGDYRNARLQALRGGRPPGPDPDQAGPDRRPGGEDRRPREGGRGPGGGGGWTGGGEDKVMAADRNLDFRVTVEEMTALAADRLRALDSNHDGRTSLEEIRAGAIIAFNEQPARGGRGGGGGRGRGEGGGGHRGGPGGGGRG